MTTTPSWRVLSRDDLDRLPEPACNWGPWLLDPEAAVLWHRDYGYEIDLERCLTSAQVLDWIMQVNGKEWPDQAATTFGLVEAFDAVLHPQQHLCSFGTSKRLTAPEAVALARRYAGPQVQVRPYA